MSVFKSLMEGMGVGSQQSQPEPSPEQAPSAWESLITSQTAAPTSSTLAAGIEEAAQELGIDPLDLATVISYETAGTFNPTKRGPTTKWGQHKGLIQFGEPQAQEYGVDWNDPVGSQLGAGGAVVKYLRSNGVKPGMGILDLYSTINAGAPGLYNRSDAHAGGAPGTVRDKVENQMSGHRRNAVKLLGYDSPSGPAGTPISQTMRLWLEF